MIAGLLASLAAGRLRVPGLVLFLAIGMAIGSDGTGWIDFADYDMTLPLLRQLAIGLTVGVSVGWLAVHGLRRAWLGSEAGYVIGTIGAAAVAFGGRAACTVGILAVYLAGLLLGSVPIPQSEPSPSFIRASPSWRR
jgi:cell volume regulation protein A